MYIKTEKTTNENEMLFIFEKDNPIFLSDKNKEDLLSELSNISDIENVRYEEGVIKVTKKNTSSWGILKVQIISNTVSFANDINQSVKEKKSEKEETEIEKKIIGIIEERVRPAIQADGGDIDFLSFEDGVVKVRLFGACTGCVSAPITLKSGIERVLKYFLPEVTEVVNVE